MKRLLRERFAAAVEQVMALVPENQHERVEQRMRGAAEMAFLLHGLEFARACAGVCANSFAQMVEITAGCWMPMQRLR